MAGYCCDDLTFDTGSGMEYDRYTLSRDCAVSRSTEGNRPRNSCFLLFATPAQSIRYLRSASEANLI